MSGPLNGSRIWVGAAATIIAVLIAAVITLISTRSATSQEATSGELRPEVWQREFDRVREDVRANQTLLRTIESHAQLQTGWMQQQTELLKDIRTELRQRGGR